MGKGKEGRVLGADIAGDFVLGVLEIKNLLELGDGLEELGLEGGEKGEDFFGGGRGGGGGGGGEGLLLGLGREEGWESAAE